MANEKFTSVEQGLKAAYDIVHNLPWVAPSKDIAAALTLLGDLEKLCRKKRVGWLATLVNQAGQAPLV